jgi:hypothetical protein
LPFLRFVHEQGNAPVESARAAVPELDRVLKETPSHALAALPKNSAGNPAHSENSDGIILSDVAEATHAHGNSGGADADISWDIVDEPKADFAAFDVTEIEASSPGVCCCV